MAVSENHLKFQQRMRESEDAKWLFARWLSEKKGFIIEMRPTTIAPTHADAPKHQDEGDLFYLDPNAEPREKLLMEVKGLNKTDFTTKESYPHPRVMFCNVKSFKRHVSRGILPTYYVLLNPARTHAIQIAAGPTHPLWEEFTCQDPHYDNVTETFYVVDKMDKDVKFFRL